MKNPNPRLSVFALLFGVGISHAQTLTQKLERRASPHDAEVNMEYPKGPFYQVTCSASLAWGRSDKFLEAKSEIFEPNLSGFSKSHAIVEFGEHVITAGLEYSGSSSRSMTPNFKVQLYRSSTGEAGRKGGPARGRINHASVNGLELAQGRKTPLNVEGWSFGDFRMGKSAYTRVDYVCSIEQVAQGS